MEDGLRLWAWCVDLLISLLQTVCRWITRHGIAAVPSHCCVTYSLLAASSVSCKIGQFKTLSPRSTPLVFGTESRMGIPESQYCIERPSARPAHAVDGRCRHRLSRHRLFGSSNSRARNLGLHSPWGTLFTPHNDRHCAGAPDSSSERDTTISALVSRLVSCVDRSLRL